MNCLLSSEGTEEIRRPLSLSHSPVPFAHLSSSCLYIYVVVCVCSVSFLYLHPITVVYEKSIIVYN